MLLLTLPVTGSALLPKALRSGSLLSRIVRRHWTKCLPYSCCSPDYFVFGHKNGRNVAEECEKERFGHKITENVARKHENSAFGHKSGRNVVENESRNIDLWERLNLTE